MARNIVTLPTEEREEPAAGRRNPVRHASNFASETCYGTIGGGPIVMIMSRVSIGFGGR